MKFLIRKASDYRNNSEIEISSLDELLSLVAEQEVSNNQIIIEKRNKHRKTMDLKFYKIPMLLDWRLTIYDDYLE